MVRETPLAELHERAGAQLTDFAGWRMPLRYGSELAEHAAVRTAAGLFDLSHMGELVVVGPEAGAALDAAITARASALEEGRAKYALLLGDDGGVLDDLIVYRTAADRFLVVANAANTALVAGELAARIDRFDAQVFDETDDIALLALQGPLAAEVLANLEVPIATDLTQLRRYRAVTTEWGDHALLVARTGYTGEDGFELYLAPEAATALWTALLETGTGSGVLPVGLAARDSLRLEAALPLHGQDVGPGIRPAQARLDFAVDLAEGHDFVGRSAVEGGLASGDRVLVGLVADGRRAARHGSAVLRPDGDPVGEVTSGALSPTLGRPIALAYVDQRAAAVGTELHLDVRGTRLPASIVQTPFLARRARA